MTSESQGTSTLKRRTPLSITGLGCVSAAGFGLDQTRQTFFTARPATGTVELVQETPYLKLRIPPSWREKAGASDYVPNLFALEAAEEALASAGLGLAELKKLRVGICLGSTVGNTNYNEEFNRPYILGQFPAADSLFQYFDNNTAQFLLRHFGLRGPAQMLNNACTSGADALGVAASWLDADLCDLVICGGTELILSKIFHGFRSLMLCSPEPCRPFDRNRQGLTLGDGAGIVILEKAGSPRRAKAQFLGYGAATDAFHPTSPHPEGRGLDQAARIALSQAGLEASQVSFVNAHGTATPHNDLAEGRWTARNIPTARVVATKGFTGHTLGAAGALEAVFTAISLMDQKLPPSKGFSTIDPEIGVTPTTGVESGRYEVALSFSLGFGGANAVLCLGRAP